MQLIARRYNLLSLKIDAKNSIKDGSASLLGIVSVVAASYFGMPWMDAVGGFVIAGYIFTVAYIALKSSSLILLDASFDRRVAEEIQTLIESNFQVSVSSASAKPVGPVFYIEVHVMVDGNMTVHDLYLLSTSIEKKVKSSIPSIEKLAILPIDKTFQAPISRNALIGGSLSTVIEVQENVHSHIAHPTSKGTK
jgi:divalent metal cation (Fe/Co/Zn/Cd) transporter